MSDPKLSERDVCKLLLQHLYNQGFIYNYKAEKRIARRCFQEALIVSNLQYKLGILSNIIGILCRYRIVERAAQDPGILTFNKDFLDAIVIDDVVLQQPANPVMVDQTLAFRQRRDDKQCVLCNETFVNVDARQQHERTKVHIIKGIKFKGLVSKYKDPNIIIQVKKGYGNSKECVPCRIGKNTVTVTIKNLFDHNIELVEVIAANASLNQFITFSTREISIGGFDYNFSIKVTFLEQRAYNYPLLFCFFNRDNEINVFKELVFECIPEKAEDLLATSPYVRPKRVIKELDSNIIEGERPQSHKKLSFLRTLKPYYLKKDYTSIFNAGLKEGTAYEEFCKPIRKLLDVPDPQNCLNAKNYVELLDLLLYMEEHQMAIDIRQYDMKSELKQCPTLFELHVPELSEHRPSLLLGDNVDIKVENLCYRGYVNEKRRDTVLISLNKKFKSVFVKGKKYDITFGFNRKVLKMEHQALELVKAHNIASLFFPKNVPNNKLDNMDFKWVNKDIDKNPEQQSAVHHIFARSSFPAPYLVFGPPGTGKTVTIVEAIQQIYRLTTKKILICTPSNNAANLINSRLTNLPNKSEILRFISHSFPINEIPEEVLSYCNIKHGEHYNPSLEEITKYRIIISTLANAGSLYNLGIQNDFFDYVIVDESGHATETETLIAIAGIISTKSKLNAQIVLAGDPEQLGPITHSPRGKLYGFDKSMLERFMKNVDIYKKNDGHFDHTVVTKLLKNYRSHPAIIKIPNEKFYDGNLQPEGNPFSNIAIGSEVLENKKFPLIFHSVLGHDEREANSPSYFNVQEILVVMNYLEQLIGSRMSGVIIKPEHIGVITPYRRQVKKLLKACEKKPWDKLTIGSVEQFQGLEREIIIISTVRSKPENIKHDLKFQLGFLCNAKRFNVAITRAKALVIVIGNPLLLQHDELWSAFINYCKTNNSFCGTPCHLDETVPYVDQEDLRRAIENLNINGGNEEVDFQRGNL